MDRENKLTVERASRRMNTLILELGVAILHLVGHIPFHHVRRFFYRLGGMKIGRGSTIHMGARFYRPSGIKIGRDSIIGEYAVLDGRDDLIIGDHVDMATGVMIYNAQHDIDDPCFKAETGKVVIEDYVFIGPRAIILSGVIIKKGAIVAAGAVVNKDVEERQVVGGVPAKEIRERSLTEFTYKLGRAAWFR
jgi:acetyltransferase-like isoleucine patch superfamily enzyme